MLRSLQACRAIATLIVVLNHTNIGIFGMTKYFGHRPFGALFDFGPAAIDFFFVLSGFIIAYVHANDVGQPGKLGSFLWKRFARIYPFYWALLAVLIPTYFLIPSIGTGYETDPEVIFSSVFLYPHWNEHLVLGVAWTMVYEIVFYLFFATAVISKRLGAIVFAAWTVGILMYPWGEKSVVGLVCHDLNLRFVAGVCVFVVVQRWRIPAPRFVAGVGVLSFFVTAMFDNYAPPISASTHIVGYTMSSTLIIAGLVQAERSGLLGAPQWLVYLGDATYAIYMVHFLTLSVIAKVTKRLALDQYLPLFVLFAIHVAGAIGVGLLCHHFVDQPLYNLTRRMFRRAKPKAPPAEVVVVPIRIAA